jgi:hypothetical protein
MQIKKLAVAAAAVGALGVSLLVASPASADYAPSAGDADGVGSDTLQYIGDFVADGNHLGAVGYNAGGGLNKLVSFDATADINARLAYGTGGGSSTSCAPGTGAALGTGNANTNHTDTVCQLNPTIVLRAGLKPILRPNGSGAGANALKFDMVAGLKNIDYARASSKQGSKFTTLGLNTSRITVGTEQFGMLTTSTGTNAVPLTAVQLKAIYEANTTGTNGLGGTGCVKWSDVGGTSTATILPLYPQKSSGTYSFFISATTGVNITAPGTCARAVEENDPQAIDDSGDPVNAIEPISGARVNLYLGLKGTGTPAAPTSGPNFGATAIKYFQDPSCNYGDATVTTPNTTGFGATGACGSATTATGLAVPGAWTPNVTFQYGIGTWWSTKRDVYIYFRAAERDNVLDQFQPGINQNLVRTLFANPCQGTAWGGVALSTGNPACVTVGPSTYGPGGAPYYASAAAQGLIASAGFTPQYSYLDVVTSTD